MDVISHGLWGRGLFGAKHPWIALFFGIMPDIFSFGIFLVVTILSGDFTIAKPEVSSIPSYVVFNYNLLHSLFICGIAIITVRFFRKDVALEFINKPTIGTITITPILV